ncbi:MAG TPA: VOC family protein [Bacillales bacterium]|nr:VOC family protein [Bacillales bacterium]
MAVSGLGTVFVYVSQLERSIDFYEKVGLKARGIEDWGNCKRGATLFFNKDQQPPMLTLWETEDVHTHNKPLLNFDCEGIIDFHKKLKSSGWRVGELERWDSEWNHHVGFDALDPDGNTIGFLEIIKK